VNSNNYTAVLCPLIQNFGLKAVIRVSDYNETTWTGVCKKAWKQSGYRRPVQYNSIRIAGYGNTSAVGLKQRCFHITDNLHTGFQINNPVGGKFGKNQQENTVCLYCRVMRLRKFSVLK
jgi:hypothetical protein